VPLPIPRYGRRMPALKSPEGHRGQPAWQNPSTTSTHFTRGRIISAAFLFGQHHSVQVQNDKHLHGTSTLHPHRSNVPEHHLASSGTSASYISNAAPSSQLTHDVLDSPLSCCPHVGALERWRRKFLEGRLFGASS
jgi:hypothetical protein